MPYATRLQRLQDLRARVDAEIRAETARQRRRRHQPTPPAHVVRAWARDVGLDVPARGSLPAAVVDDYLTAHPEER